MDKIDGPYYFFKAIQKVRGWLPQWAPLVGTLTRPLPTSSVTACRTS